MSVMQRNLNKKIGHFNLVLFVKKMALFPDDTPLLDGWYQAVFLIQVFVL